MPTCLPIRSLSLGIGSGAAAALPAINLPRAPSGAGRQLQLHSPAAAAQAQHSQPGASALAREPSATDSQHAEPHTPVMRPTAQRMKPGSSLPFALEAAGWSSPQPQQQQQRLFQNNDTSNSAGVKSGAPAGDRLQPLSNGHADTQVLDGRRMAAENGRRPEGAAGHAFICMLLELAQRFVCAPF